VPHRLFFFSQHLVRAGLDVFTDGLFIVPQIFRNISSPFVQGSAPAPDLGMVKWTLSSAAPMQLVNSTSRTGLLPNTGITLIMCVFLHHSCWALCLLTRLLCVCVVFVVLSCVVCLVSAVMAWSPGTRSWWLA
jgi:hypothetical protein